MTRTPTANAVRAIADAADTAQRSGMTFDAFVASAIWAAKMSDLLMPHPEMTITAIDGNYVRNEWHVVEDMMDEERQ